MVDTGWESAEMGKSSRPRRERVLRSIGGERENAPDGRPEWLAGCVGLIQTRKPLLIWILVGVACSAVGCKAEVPPTQIRIKNQSDYVLEDVTVRFSGRELSFDAIAPNATTEYREISTAVHYCPYMKMVVDGLRLEHKPIDHHGVPYYEHGKFTLVLVVDFTRGTGGALYVKGLELDEFDGVPRSSWDDLPQRGQTSPARRR